MYLKLKSSDQAHGMHSEWIRKELITGHVKTMALFINRRLYQM
jgi:hypothetical protein